MGLLWLAHFSVAKRFRLAGLGTSVMPGKGRTHVGFHGNAWLQYCGCRKMIRVRPHLELSADDSSSLSLPDSSSGECCWASVAHELSHRRLLLLRGFHLRYVIFCGTNLVIFNCDINILKRRDFFFLNETNIKKKTHTYNGECNAFKCMCF